MKRLWYIVMSVFCLEGMGLVVENFDLDGEIVSFDHRFAMIKSHREVYQVPREALRIKGEPKIGMKVSVSYTATDLAVALAKETRKHPKKTRSHP